MTSDKGNQFVNSHVDALLKKFCITHKITSPYHPQTNGATEIVNKIVCNCLTKLVDENPNDWPKLVPFVVLAYNNKVNNVTKFSPYVIVFGKSPNGFEDWRTKQGQDEATALLTRSLEIRNMIENIRPQALKNIEKAQVTQRKSQNNRSKHILRSDIEIGTKVMLRNEELVTPKLSPKYTGPYTVVNIGKLGNYQLKDINNNILPQYVNINRLRITEYSESSDEDTDPIESRENSNIDPNLPRTSKSAVQEKLPFQTESRPTTTIKRKKKEIQELPSEDIDQIKTHKKVNNRYLYLVKWLNFPESENEWLEAKAFDDKQTLDDYWAKQPYDLRKSHKARYAKKQLSPYTFHNNSSNKFWTSNASNG